MERSITGYHPDDQGDWVAELSCGHNQHVRHRPPFQLRPWVLVPEGRAEHLGTGVSCPLCDRAELPEGLRPVRSSPEWNEHTMPAGLRRGHRIAAGTWGRILVRQGRLRFVGSTVPPLEVVVEPGRPQPIPPDLEHEVRSLGPVRFSIELLAVDRGHGDRPSQEGRSAAVEDGGDPACWAHLVDGETGAISDGQEHR